MADKPPNGNQPPTSIPPSGTGIALGLALGTGLGIVLDNLAIGIALGVALGAAYDGWNASRKRS